MKRLAAEVARDLGDQLKAEELDPVLQRLEIWAIPEPGPEETAALLAAIRPLMPEPEAQVTPRFRSYAVAPPGASLLRTLLPQLRLMHPLWWIGALLVAVAGAFAAGEGLPLWAAAPLLVVGGVWYSVRSLRGGALELELACPVTPVQIMLGRMLLVLGYCLLLGFIGAAAGPDGAPLALLGWLSALVLFAGLMLTLTIFADLGTATALSLAAWAALLILSSLRPALFPAPGTRPWLGAQLAALLAGGVLVIFAATGAGLSRLLRQGGA